MTPATDARTSIVRQNSLAHLPARLRRRGMRKSSGSIEKIKKKKNQQHRPKSLPSLNEMHEDGETIEPLKTSLRQKKEPQVSKKIYATEKYPFGGILDTRRGLLALLRAEDSLHLLHQPLLSGRPTGCPQVRGQTPSQTRAQDHTRKRTRTRKKPDARTD